MVDAAILVVRAGRTAHQQVARAIEALGRDRVLGVVLNCVTEQEFDSSYKEYAHYYSTPGAE
jgi:Mrp family chromosome partitioning ATPase